MAGNECEKHSNGPHAPPQHAFEKLMHLGHRLAKRLSILGRHHPSCGVTHEVRSDGGRGELVVGPTLQDMAVMASFQWLLRSSIRFVLSARQHIVIVRMMWW